MDNDEDDVANEVPEFRYASSKDFHLKPKLVRAIQDCGDMFPPDGVPLLSGCPTLQVSVHKWLQGRRVSATALAHCSQHSPQAVRAQSSGTLVAQLCLRAWRCTCSQISELESAAAA